MIPSLDEYRLNEIGDGGSKAFPYTRRPGKEPVYDFVTTKGTEYLVGMDDSIKGEVDIVFDTDQGMSITNNGEVFSVMATILKIVQEYVKNTPGLRVITFDGIKRGGKKDKEGSSGRTNLYMVYLKRNAPKDWVIRQDRNKVTITLP